MLLPRALRGRVVRNAALAVVGVFLVYRYLGGAPWDEEGTESARLARLMNGGVDAAAVQGTKSSFNWAGVPLQRPLGRVAGAAGEEQPLVAGGGLTGGQRQSPSQSASAGGKAKAKAATRRKRPRIQHAFGDESSAARRKREARRDEVRDVFRRDWAVYREVAWGMDSLAPLRRQGNQQFCGWAATLVDALDTLWIMGLRAEFDEAVAAVGELDFGTASCMQVNTFETTIRYLGGLLAAYDLSGRKVLLRKAVELGDMLVVAFHTNNGMPVDFMMFERAKTGEELLLESLVVSASPGTLSLELAHLSQVTGDSRYYDAVRPVMELFARGQNETKVPGLWPMFVSMSTMDVVTGGHFTLSGGADSMYEYMAKMHSLLLEGRGGLVDDKGMYEQMTRGFLEAADKRLVFRPMTPGEDDILLSGFLEADEAGNGNITAQSEHLACFIGGVWALSGRLFGRADLVETGIKMTRGCAWTYRAMPTGMGPERFNLVPCDSRTSCRWDEDEFYRRARQNPGWRENEIDILPKGFAEVSDKRYILRPEAIESVFVLWRITGRHEFQDAAWEMWRGISRGTDAGNITAAVKDVTSRTSPTPKEDYMESFWFAETLKYFYLAFSPPDLISLDDFVLNTEAHPFRLR